jgi:hypothetical protein
MYPLRILNFQFSLAFYYNKMKEAYDIISLCLFIRLSVCLSAYQSVSVYLSVYPI